MQTFRAGDHLVTNLDIIGLTEHHGLYIGDDMVIHLSKAGIIEEIHILLFSNENKVRVKKSTHNAHQAVKFARSKLGSTSYNLTSNNCEQFVNECLDERRTSNQVSNIAHVATQGAARSGLLGRTASRVAMGTAANVALVSTAAKMAGEYVGLPDNVNTIIGTPGDLIGKPIECLISGSTKTLGDTYDCIANGEFIDAGSTLVFGTIGTVATSVIIKPLEVGVIGIQAGAELVADAWDWLWD
jgi:hypothetical protein